MWEGGSIDDFQALNAEDKVQLLSNAVGMPRCNILPLPKINSSPPARRPFCPQKETHFLKKTVFQVRAVSFRDGMFPRKVTWNPNMEVWKMMLGFRQVIFMLVFTGVCLNAWRICILSLLASAKCKTGSLPPPNGWMNVNLPGLFNNVGGY